MVNGGVRGRLCGYVYVYVKTDLVHGPERVEEGGRDLRTHYVWVSVSTHIDLPIRASISRESLHPYLGILPAAVPVCGPRPELQEEAQAAGGDGEVVPALFVCVCMWTIIVYETGVIWKGYLDPQTPPTLHAPDGPRLALDVVDGRLRRRYGPCRRLAQAPQGLAPAALVGESCVCMCVVSLVWLMDVHMCRKAHLGCPAAAAPCSPPSVPAPPRRPRAQTRPAPRGTVGLWWWWWRQQHRNRSINE